MCLRFVFLPMGSHKDGYETFASWKKVWTSNGKSEPSLKAFMADQQLPFWVSTGCIPASCLTAECGDCPLSMMICSFLGSVYETGLQEVASADEGDPAHCFPSSDVPLRNEVQQHQGKQEMPKESKR